VLLAAFGVVLFVFAVGMLVVSVQDRRREAARHPQEVRAQLGVVAQVVRIAVAVPAAVFTIFLLAQGFVWQALPALVLALLAWLWAARLARRSRD
jgi:predicted MFS family arabinose efflux permease